MDYLQQTESLIARARAAQQQIAMYSQKQVDAIVRQLAKVVYDHAEPLARMAADETRMGVYEDKVQKNRGKARILWHDLRDKPSVGVLRCLPELGLTEIGKPMGVVVAVTPCTNPIVTPMCNAMFAIKCRNAIVIAPHPRAKGCAKRLAELYHQALEALGAPVDLFLVAEEPAVEMTNLLMQQADVVIATGGMGMVKSAYSSGKPSFGVGAGNVQCIVDSDADLDAAVPKIVAGRCFDNGIICSGEQTIITPAERYEEVIARLEAQGAYYTEEPTQVDALREAVFPGGAMNRHLVGQSAAQVLAAAGIDTGHNDQVRLVVVRPQQYGAADVFSKEKMCPLMSAYSYQSWGEALDIANANLSVEGSGHSVAIHSRNQDHLEAAGLVLPVSRVLVNQSCATMSGGAFANALSPTTTLGCGSWGNNSISENLTYYHLMNKTRVACEKPSWEQPSDQEIWG